MQGEAKAKGTLCLWMDIAPGGNAVLVPASASFSRSSNDKVKHPSSWPAATAAAGHSQFVGVAADEGLGADRTRAPQS